MAPAKRSAPEDRLAAYRSKRSAGRTPEPFGGAAAPGPLLFVVQKHAARHTHYDLRLEIEGALHSWAVPRGPSLDPAVKRLAVEVEDHPLEYAQFEGKIPAGNYGAGAVIVWDRGRWEPVDDPIAGLETGKLLFDLHGYKLRGRWTLFRTTKGKPKEWLLMKKPDAWAAKTDPDEASVVSGLTVEELREGVDPVARVVERLAQLRAPRQRIAPSELEPMLAQTADGPFTAAGWLFELKYDGYRLLAAKEGESVTLRYRRGSDTTALFPEVAVALAQLPFRELVLDGELVVLDEAGRPSFQRLQGRACLRRTTDIARGAAEAPATLVVFDLLSCEGHDVRSLPLVQRKELLSALLPRVGPLRYSDHVEAAGEAMYEQVCRLGLEGLVAKRADSRYRSGRSGDWLKIPADRSGDFVIVGYSTPERPRTGSGALHLAQYEGQELAYSGRVGTGFSEALLRELSAQLEPLQRADPPCTGAPSGRGHVWVEPRLVCQVRYKEWTAAGHLRLPVFERMREDKRAAECVRETASPEPVAPPEEPAPDPAPAALARQVRFTNPDKVFWPAEGYTKGDLVEYYRRMAPNILPYLRDRPLVLTRYPDGIEGKSFFQKDAPVHAPAWVRIEKMWSEHGEREIRYFVCDDEETLLYLINLGTIPLHLWSSRVAALQHPDWCILDLDPKDAPFGHVIELARAIHALCDEIGLECFVKTSGSTGLHVLLPLGGSCTYDQSRSLGEVLARILATENGAIATIARNPAARGGRVYVDFLQNGHGKLLVAPYSVRPLPGAPVSTPLRWSEVRPGLDLKSFTLRTVPARARRAGARDPLVGILDRRPDLPAVLARLLERLERVEAAGQAAGKKRPR